MNHIDINGIAIMDGEMGIAMFFIMFKECAYNLAHYVIIKESINNEIHIERYSSIQGKPL